MEDENKDTDVMTYQDAQRKDALSQNATTAAVVPTGAYNSRPQTHQENRRAITGEMSAGEGFNMDYGQDGANPNLRSIEHLSTQQ